ncbi:hypothetical protein C1H46_028687 [Malus baccata]|uniref:Uncharacterized protein n=1 Tax=Malus baccata TaxID=106549 RepID=A0A540LH21_MALBA|nr:hypothetical protein C1H46_028687 [Malus baccata]
MGTALAEGYTKELAERSEQWAFQRSTCSKKFTFNGMRWLNNSIGSIASFPDTSFEELTLIEDAGLQVMTETLDHILDRRPDRVYWGMENARHLDIGLIFFQR